MSLFQCEECGAKENTALSCRGIGPYAAEWFDWEGIEDRKGKYLCSACGPTKFKDGSPSELGKWHGVFPRVILPLGQFKTNQQGNLEHKENGDTDLSKYIDSQ